MLNVDNDRDKDGGRELLHSCLRSIIVLQRGSFYQKLIQDLSDSRTSKDLVFNLANANANQII